MSMEVCLGGNGGQIVTSGPWGSYARGGGTNPSQAGPLLGDRAATRACLLGWCPSLMKRQG